MSRYIRPRLAGATVFFTVTLAARGSALLVDEIGALRGAARATRAERPFGIDAWVVLPDHMHCVWTLPEGDADYSTRMGAIKARFTMAVRRAGVMPALARANPYGAIGGRRRGGGGSVGGSVDQHKDEAPVWQKRFWEHHIRDQVDFNAHVQYCWFNPVKHGFVERPEDWPYSSYHRDAG